MIDSHSHIDADAFVEDLDQILARAQAAGISHIVDPGCDVPSSRRAVELAARFDNVYAAVGIHPHSAKEYTEAARAELESLAKSHSRVVAIGEAGLDFHYNFSPPEDQRVCLRAHLDMARALDMPLILHCRLAESELIETLRPQAPWRGVVHCFTGPADAAMQLVELGFYIGITGIVTFKKSIEVQQTARTVPLHRLLVETDAPYLAPIPYRGKRNEPAYVAKVVEAVAALRGVPVETVAQATAENARSLFGIG